MSSPRKKHAKPNQPKPQKPRGCVTAPDGTSLDSYAAIVRDYLKHYKASADAVLLFYQQIPTLDDAIKKAAYAELPNGKRHPHQYRLKRANLKKVHYRLRNCNLAACETFHELFETVEDAIGGISGIGELMIYDTTHRLGAHLGLQPERVYLHAGVRVGAVALGFEKSRKWLETTELPRPFRRLTAQQLEDCFCIYKYELQAIRDSKK